MLSIRFQRRGKKNQPSFRLVVAPKEASLKGKVIEDLGFYSPITKEARINKERTLYWISKGAKPSDSVWNLLVSQKIIQGPKRKIKLSTKKEKKK